VSPPGSKAGSSSAASDADQEGSEDGSASSQEEEEGEVRSEEEEEGDGDAHSESGSDTGSSSSSSSGAKDDNQPVPDARGARRPLEPYEVPRSGAFYEHDDRGEAPPPGSQWVTLPLPPLPPRLC
jgi:hypothetical protein